MGLGLRGGLGLGLGLRLGLGLELGLGFELAAGDTFEHVTHAEARLWSVLGAQW